MAVADRKALLIVFLTVFVDLLGFGLVMPLLPLYGQSLDASGAVIGVLMSSFSAMQFVFAPLWGRLSDHIGRRPVILVGLAGSVVFYGLFGYASSIQCLTLLLISRFGAGVCCATIPTAQAFIADCTPPEQRTSGMVIIGAAFGAGFTFGPILGAAAFYFDPRPVGELSALPGYLAAGFSAIALAFGIAYLPETRRPETTGAAGHHRTWFDLGSLRAAASVAGVLPSLLVFFIATFAFANFEGTIARFFRNALQLTDQQNFLMFAYLGVCLTLAQGVVVRRLAKRWPERRLALCGAGLMLVGMIGLVWTMFQGSTTIALIILPVLVTGFALLTTSTQGMISRLSRAEDQGGILGLNQSASALARILGPFLGNLLYGREGSLLPLWLGVALLALTLPMLTRLPTWPQHEPIEQPGPTPTSDSAPAAT